MVTREFPLADVGEGLTEAELSRWLVAVGDTVAVNDPVCEIETAKSVVELPAPYAGVVEELLVAEGETVPVGTPLLRLAEGPAGPAEGSLGRVEGSPGPAEGSLGDEAPVPVLVGSGAKSVATSRRPRRGISSAGPGDLSAGPGDPSTRPGDPLRVLAKPAARLAAREAGIDLAELAPSRPDGVLTPDDLAGLADVARAEGRHTADGVDDPRPDDAARTSYGPLSSVQRAMAQAMTTSAQVPQATIWTSVDAARTLELIARLRTHADFRDLKVTPLLVIAKAALLAVRRTPSVNSTWGEDGIALHEHVNLGIAAATPRGLVVPNVKGADTLGLPALAAALADLTATARAGRTAPADQVGGTLTITNVGPFGIEGGTPLLNPGESAILCVGTIARRPWVVGDEVVVRDVVTLSLSIDHRHIDGETGSRFLADVAALVEDPALGLTY